MNATLTIDKAGRIVIPKAVRDELNLTAGDTIELESEGECVTLRPSNPASRLIRHRGIWMYRATGKQITVEDINRVQSDINEDRSRRLLSGDFE